MSKGYPILRLVVALCLITVSLGAVRTARSGVITPRWSTPQQGYGTLFYDDFSTSQNWIDDSGGGIYRDSANEWLVWNVQRDIGRRYYIPLDAASDDIYLEFTFNVTGASGNGNVHFGLVEQLYGSYDNPNAPTGFFVTLIHDTLGLDLVHQWITYADAPADQPPPSPTGGWDGASPDDYVGLDQMNRAYQVGVSIENGEWAVNVSDELTYLGDIRGSMSSHHDRYRYLMIFRDYTGGWESMQGILDNVAVTGFVPGDPRTEYPITYDFNDDSGFTSTTPNIWINDGLVTWNVSRSGGEQYLYADIPPFLGGFILKVTGQINTWDNNCNILIGVGDTVGEGYAMSWGYTGGGCPSDPAGQLPPGPVLQMRNVTVSYGEGPNACEYYGDWLMIESHQWIEAELVIGNADAMLDLPASPTEAIFGAPNPYDGVFDTLYIGQSGDGDWPHCGGLIDSVTLDPFLDVPQPDEIAEPVEVPVADPVNTEGIAMYIGTVVAGSLDFSIEFFPQEFWSCEQLEQRALVEPANIPGTITSSDGVIMDGSTFRILSRDDPAARLPTAWVFSVGEVLEKCHQLTDWLYATDTHSAVQPSTMPFAEPTVFMNVRTGPSRNFPVLGEIQVGETYPIVGVDPTFTWWQIEYGGSRGWVLAELVTVTGDTSFVPIIAPTVTATPAG